jgi:hypothetical protein
MENEFNIGDVVKTHLDDIGVIVQRDESPYDWVVEINYTGKSHFEQYRNSELTLIEREKDA